MASRAVVGLVEVVYVMHGWYAYLGKETGRV
jgi:hypothetical protein